MSSTTFRARWAIWAAVCVLLLKSAVPMLAGAAASVQGRSVADICSVYGVALPAAGETRPSHDPDSQSAAGHAGDHCALSALAVLAGLDAQSPVWPAAIRAGATPVARFDSVADASARWIARMKQGPPVRA